MSCVFSKFSHQKLNDLKKKNHLSNLSIMTLEWGHIVFKPVIGWYFIEYSEASMTCKINKKYHSIRPTILFNKFNYIFVLKQMATRLESGDITKHDSKTPHPLEAQSIHNNLFSPFQTSNFFIIIFCKKPIFYIFSFM